MQPPGGSYDGPGHCRSHQGRRRSGGQQCKPHLGASPPWHRDHDGRVRTRPRLVEQAYPANRSRCWSGDHARRDPHQLTRHVDYRERRWLAADHLPYTAKNTRDLIRSSLYASNLATTAQHFLADRLSLQRPRSTDAGQPARVISRQMRESNSQTIIARFRRIARRITAPRCWRGRRG